jgi:predicted RNA-binding protein with PUA-like domain
MTKRRKQSWLMKSEPNTFSIEDLRRQDVAWWEGVRNYQARDFLRDQMAVGDEVLFYHSSSKPPGVAGLAQVCGTARPDHHAWDPASPYFDPTCPAGEPRWWMVPVKFVAAFAEIVSLDQLRSEPRLTGLGVIRKGNRLSIQPVSAAHYRIVVTLAHAQDERSHVLRG